MSKLSEKKIIELFQNRLGNASFIPEDVESFKIEKNLNEGIYSLSMRRKEWDD